MNFVPVPITLHMFVRAVNNRAVFLLVLSVRLIVMYKNTCFWNILIMQGCTKVTSSWGYLYAAVVETLELTLNCFYK
jgi:hypothetical protein